MTLNNALLISIQDGLTETLDGIEDLQWVRSLSGGDINQAALLRSGNTNWFVKYHRNAATDMFPTEAHALREISEQGCIRVPSPIAMGNCGEISWLVLEYLDLTSRGSTAQLGEQLAAMHRVSHDRYGWYQNNYIGSNRQFNSSSDNWAEFWRDSRLQPQFSMAQAAGYGGRLLSSGERLLSGITQLMDGHQPAASLLHGDLWAGNKAFTSEGQAVIFDPASYHGDRETDIAMTELFGGFDATFYAAYQDHYPLPDAYPLRRDLYNLYHMLNHLNLFGRAYLGQCERMIDSLLAEIH